MNTNSKNELIRLNKFLAHAGIADRRTCDSYIKQGLVKVNDKLITEPGTKVRLEDVVLFRENRVKPEKKVYILLNKPKNFDFEANHKGMSIFDLIKNFPKDLNLGYTPKVFSLDEFEKDELGLMLITNDDLLLEEYQNKENKIRSVYNIVINKPILEKDIEKLEKGIKTKFGNYKVEEIKILDETNQTLGFGTKSILPNEISIVFGILGYEIIKLDRTIFSDLTKRDLPRGRWRFLNENEIVKLKHLKY